MSFQTLTTPEWERSRFLILCDHASPLFPAGFQETGLSEDDHTRHIAVDIGAAEVTRLLAMRLGAKALLGGYSRLVVDLNRTPEREDLIRNEYDGTSLSFNQNLDEPTIANRIARYFRPYHEAVAAAVTDLQIRHGDRALVVLVHSFTPAPQIPTTHRRDCDIGVVWNKDEKSAHHLMEWLRQSTDYRIGDNEPYSGKRSNGGTITMHMEPSGIRHVMVEIRQDLIAALPGQLKIAQALGAALDTV